MSYGRSRDNRGNGNRGLGFGGGRPPMGPKPVEVGKEYDVEVTELSRRGDGVAKVQGFVIFVQGAKVGQKVKIKVDRVGPRLPVLQSLEVQPQLRLRHHLHLRKE